MTWLIEHLILRRKRAYRTLGQIPMPRGCALKDWELIQLIFLRKWNGWSRSPPIMIRRSRSHFGLNSDGLPFHFNFLPAAPFNSPSLFSLEICNSSLIVPPGFSVQWRTPSLPQSQRHATLAQNPKRNAIGRPLMLDAKGILHRNSTKSPGLTSVDRCTRLNKECVPQDSIRKRKVPKIR